MYSDSRSRFPELYDYAKYENLDFYFHARQDPRITRVGSFIRRTSIDELPNFANVLLGQMTLVGPRPEVPEVELLYGDYSRAYLSVKPGITCLSKITGRDALTKEESIKMDIEYVNRRCLSLDLYILWQTAKGVLLRKHVYANRAPATFGLQMEGRPAGHDSEIQERSAVLMGIGVSDSD
jgi:lipopolysaccharide/colanic/teichoic acid biosynthesis glycosyltransferase